MTEKSIASTFTQRNSEELRGTQRNSEELRGTQRNSEELNAGTPDMARLEMSNETKDLPNPSEIAAKILDVVLNTVEPVAITNNQLKELSEREKFREGLKKPIIDILEMSGVTVTVKNSGIIVSDPCNEPSPISFSAAKAQIQKDIDDCL